MIQDNFAIAGIQINIPSNPQAEGYNNIARMEQSLIDLTAVYPWVNMAVFSELCTFGPLTAYSVDYEYALEQFCRMARTYNIWLVPGTLYNEVDGKIYNTAPVIRPDGTLQGTYSKMFPWYPYEEGVAPGEDFFTFDIEGVGKFGVLICYDAWQPELWRSLACEGVSVVLNPTMTDMTDLPIEKSIIHAMSAINQMYVFHVNGFGGTAGTCGWGESMVAGPDGRILHQAGAREEIFPIEIDINAVVQSRTDGVRYVDQSLKSFRERPIRRYAVYDEGPDKYTEYLNSLGPLVVPPKRNIS
ncbi:carbon-nitrogen hydrolase family protein [Sedimentitalea sp.]|uniref:carbon-nitrogen hydrolase family protein n=1 Tax=Sedimentitalea sp. TaxID=2048915 RepID=UPI003298CCA6